MSKYPTRLERFTYLLDNPPHPRHSHLPKLARAGRLAGIDSGELARLIHSHWDGAGPHPLEDREVASAIGKAEAEVPLGGDIPEGQAVTQAMREGILAKAPPAPAKGKCPTAGQRAFFARMADRGQGWMNSHPQYGGKRTAALRALSPVKFDPSGWGEQAALMIDRLATDWLGFTFAGDRYTPRDSRHLYQAEALADGIRAGQLAAPPQVMANQLSGDRAWVPPRDGRQGYWSLGKKECVLHYRHAVIEFDGDPATDRKLPLETQADFWIGCITSGTIYPVSLTYSGAKSIHGIMRLLEMRDRAELSASHHAGGTLLEHYAELAQCPPADLTPEALWTAQWRDLEALLGSSTDSLYHLDGACKDITRLTRLAGHLRKDTGKRQALLYIDRADPRDLPRPDEGE